MRRISGLILAAAISAAACTDDILNGDNGSGGDFAISVGSGTTPLYTWSEGPAFSLAVVRTSNQTDVVWRVTSTAGTMASPVRQGTVPAGALESVDDERTLAPGVQYRVSITLADGRSAFQVFQP
ncbi:MAG: hypothetical protein ACREL7_17670 [Longimicrobiales bacterium]